MSKNNKYLSKCSKIKSRIELDINNLKYNIQCKYFNLIQDNINFDNKQIINVYGYTYIGKSTFIQFLYKYINKFNINIIINEITYNNEIKILNDENTINVFITSNHFSFKNKIISTIYNNICSFDNEYITQCKDLINNSTGIIQPESFNILDDFVIELLNSYVIPKLDDLIVIEL